MFNEKEEIVKVKNALGMLVIASMIRKLQRECNYLLEKIKND